MADVNSNININFNTADALAQLRRLQAGLSKFHQSLAEGNLAAANAQKGLNAQLAQAIGATGKFAVSQAKVASSTLAFTTALEKNKLSLREYYRYSMAAATANTKVLGKAFAQEREIINRARRDRVKALQAQYIQMAKAQGGFIDAMRVMPRTLMMANGRFTELGTRIQYAAQRQQFLNQLLKQGSTSLLNFGKNTQWAGRQLMVGLTMPLMMLGGYASKAFRDLEKATVKFKRVYGDAFTNDAQVEEAVKNIRQLANEYTKFGVSVVDTMDMAATAAAAGFQGADLTRQVETATKLAVLGQVEQQQALETTISLQNAFGLSSEQLAEKINFLNAVENQTVLSIEDLTIAIPKAAPVIKQLGGNVEDLAFFLTAMKEGGINASEGANALKSGLASLINPTDKASKMLGEMGINIKGIVESNKGDIKGTVVGFARALDTLDPLNRARAIEQLFGKFQFARLSTLFQNVSKDGTQAARAFDLAGASVEELAVLSEREMKKVEDAVGTKFQAAVEQFKQDIMPLGKAFLEAVTPIVKFFGKLFEKFNGLGDQTKKVIAIIVGVVAGLGPILLMTFGLLANGLANLIKLFATIRGGIAKLNGQTSVLGAGFNYVTQEQLEQQAAGQALHNTHTRLTEVFNIEKVAALQLAAAYQQMSTQMRGMASQNPALFAGGLRGAAGAVSKLPKGPVGFEDGIISVPGPKGAGDIIPAMVSPGESIISAEKSEKYRGLITAIFQDKVPGFVTGKLPGAKHPAPSRITDLKMPKSFAETQTQRAIAEKLSKAANSGEYAKVKPTNFGTLVEPFTGRSFPVPGVGGVYRQPDGKLVVVKPTINPDTAKADIRSNKLTSLHGINTPKSKIAKMLDPTDPEGKRSYIVLVSKYDKNFSPAGMTGKFTKQDMIKQLVAASIRGDKDLQMSNISGRNAPDASNAYIFPKGSGFREIASSMPSMEQMALINTLAVKGGAKKFFAQQTSSLAGKMSPQEYDAAIKNEIRRVLPLYKKEITSGKDFQNLNTLEKQAYANVIQRLEAGLKTDWTKVHSAHIRAGGNIPRYEEGINKDASRSIVEKTLKNFLIPKASDQVRISQELRQSMNLAFDKKLAELYKKDPERAKAIQGAWLGNSKGFRTPRQSQFIGEIAKMHSFVDPVTGQVMYVHKDDYNKFISDPQKNINYARTRDQIEEKLLYRMGVIKRNGDYVAKGKFAGRFAKLDKFSEDLRFTGKAAGGGRSALLSHVKSIADQEKLAYNKQLGLDSDQYAKTDLQKSKIISSNAGKALKAVGFSDSEIISKLKPELSHIDATGKQGIGGRDTQAKFQQEGMFARYDSNIVNRYIGKGTPRFKNLLDWSQKQLNANKPSPYTAEQIRLLKPAAQFMSTGQHPVSNAERRMVAQAAEMDVKMNTWMKQTGLKPNNYSLPKDIRNAMGISALIGDGSSKVITPSRIMHLGAKESGLVLADADREYMYNKTTNTYERIQGPKPGSAVVYPTTGSKKDTTLTRETSTKTVANKNQIKELGATKAPVVLRGREDASQTGKYLRLQREKELQKQGKSEEEISRAIKAQEKNEKKKAIAKAKEAKAAQTAAQRAEVARKDQEYRARQSTILQQKVNAAHEEALRMNKKFDKDAAKEKAKQAKALRQEKVGRFSGGASMALGTAGMAAMMSGNTGLGMGLMGVSAVAGMAPMLAGMGPVGWVTTAALAVGTGLFALNKHLENAAKKQAAYVESVSGTTAKMEQIGAITNKVGASRAMDEVRSKGLFNDYNDVRRAGTRFGDTFLQSDVGKQMAEGFVKNMEQFGSKQAAQNFGLQLATYISDGVLTAEQASSIAEQIGVKLGSRSYTVDIIGNVESLVGPDGENLKNNPLEVRTKIIETANQRSFAELNALKETGGRDSAARIAGLSLNNIEIAKAQADATEWQYRKQIQVLQKQLEQTTNLEKQLELKQKIAVLEGDMATDTAEMGKKLSDQINAEISIFEKNIQKDRSPLVAWLLPGDDEEDAYFDALKSRVQEKFKDTFPGLTQQLQKDLSTLSDKLDLSSRGFTGGSGEAQKFEVLANLTMGQGFSDPQQFSEIMKTFAGKEGNLYKTMRLGFDTHGPKKTMEMLDFFTGFEDKDLAVQISTDIMSKDPEQFDKIGKAVAQMAVMDGHEVNMEAFIKTHGIEGLEKLSADLDKIEKIQTPITKEAIAKLTEMGISGITEGSMQTLMSQWKDWDALPDVAKKEAISKYKTVYDIVFTSEAAKLEWARKLAAEQTKGIKDQTARGHVAELIANSLASDANAAEKIASEAARTYVGEDGKIYSKDGGPLNNNSGDGGTKQDPYEEILRRLKSVRNAAINAAGGIKELNKALADSGSKSVKNKFMGIEQQLGAQGYSRQFSDWLMSMDAKEQVNWMRTASEKFTSGKNKGRVKNPFTGKAMGKNAKIGDVVLSQGAKTGNSKFDAVAMSKAFDAAIVGEFNSAAGKSLTILNEQEVVRRKLSALGYDATSIERILQDEYTTSAIANGKITDQELQTNVVLNNQVVLREKINGLISQGLKAQQQAANVKQIPKVLEFFAKMSGQGIKLSSGAMLDMIGDPDQLAAAIAAMQDYESNAEGARDRLKEIVDGLNAIKANSDIKLIMDFVSKNPAEKAQAGFEAAKRVMEVRRKMYSNMTIGELPGISTASRVAKDGTTIAGKNIGQQAVANVAARYKAAGVAIPTINPGDTLAGIQKKRADLAKTMQIGQQALAAIQTRYSAKQDELNNAQDNLEKALDAANDKYDKLIQAQEDKIKSLEDQIKINYEDKITALNKESEKLSNDLAIMDHVADKINEKYDKQIEALEKVSQINQDIAESQQQQLGLADALSQGDIAAAARAAQEMRASEQERAMTAQMSTIEQARKNELGALRGAETGMTREQISERQFEIQQAIYKIETDPARLELEKQIEDAKTEITRLDKERETTIVNINKEHDALITKLNGELATINNELTAQKGILSTLEKQDTELASQETYLQSIVDEAVALDDSTGMTLEKWEETVDKLIDIEKLAEDYAISLAAAEASAAATETSWGKILETINAIPESVTTNQIINEIRNITENITRYINTIYTSSGSTGSTGSTSSTDATAAALRKLQSSGVDSLTDEERKLLGLPPKSSTSDSAALQKLKEAEAKAAAEAAEAAKKAAAEKAAAEEKARAEAAAKALEESLSRRTGWFGDWGYENRGGLISKYLASGGLAIGTDVVPAMLTPGEFVMSRYAVQNHGLDTLKAINNGDSVGDSVYNYSINVNVKSDANPDDIARAVMSHIKQVDSKRLRGARL